MTERLSPRVESLFHEALERSEDEREEFLVAACAGNTSLYNEVKSLLQSYSLHQQFFEEMAVAKHVLDQPASAFIPGALLGSYELVRLLGKGGMGEVYLARDQKLGRKVAVKILPETLSRNSELIERLYREAKTASALNHPNILTIHDFGEQGDARYMVMEFVEGTQLREHIGRLSVARALDYARQIGQALQAAHQVGIVHRDIKPENVMVRSDGYVKVVDFGLAKLANPSLATGESLVARLSTSNVSMPGVLIGTVNYMSPEQARGQQVDLRTDIWSWGVVLYEMLSARRPFDAATSSDVLAGILNKAPDPPTADENLNLVVSRALAKEVDERYPSMGIALEELAGIPGGSALPGRSSRAKSPQLFRPNLRARRLGKVVWLAVSAVLVALGGAQAYRWWEANRPFRSSGTHQLTYDGNVTCVAISPDGNYLAYAEREETGYSLKVLEIKTNSVQSRVSGELRKFIGITFAKDGFIYYVVKDAIEGTLYRIPPLGDRPPLPVANDVDSRISFSPGEESYVFERWNDKKKADSLILREKDGNGEKVLPTPELKEQCKAPIWLPEGDRVLCGILSTEPPAGFRILSVSVSGRGYKLSDPKPWSWASPMTWLKNGRSVAISVTEPGSTNAQPVALSWPGGVATPIIHDPFDYLDLDSTADSQSLAALQMTRLSEIWIIPVNGDPYQLKGLGKKMYSATWIDSESFISQADIYGRQDLYTIRLGGGAPVPLTQDAGIKKHPAVSPDRSHIVYTSDRGGVFHLWVSGPSGEPPKRLTRDKTSEDDAAITPDGQAVVYTGIRDESFALLKISFKEGDSPTRVIPNMQARKPALSPDGKHIAFEAEGKNGWSIFVTDMDGGNPHSFPDVPAGNLAPLVRWSADGRELLYVKSKDNADNVWAQQWDAGRPPHPLTSFKQEHISAFALSQDGKMACARGPWLTDVVLIQNSK